MTNKRSIRTKRGLPIATPSRALGFMPDKFRTKLRYAEYFTVSATLGAITRHEFIANGLYDPSFTGIGHQPYGFDQLIGMYSYAVVHSCRSQITGAVGPGYEHVYVLLQQGPSVLSAPADIGAAVERSTKTNWALSTPFNPIRLHDSGTTSEFLGIPDNQQLAETNLYNSSAANPSLVWYVRLYVQPADGSSTSYFRALVELEFDVTFVKPVTQATS